MEVPGRLPLEGVDDRESAPRGDEGAWPFQLAARASYLTPVLALAVGMSAGALFGQRQTVRGAVIVGAINLVILSAGVVLAGAAALGIRRHGARGILWPAVTGVLINLAFIGIIVLQWAQYRRGK